MARDNKLTFKFLQTAFNAANQFAVSNYGFTNTGAGSGGAAFMATSAGTSGIWYRGASIALNRGGFRDTNADQSILVSGETSAILNDPAMIGGTSATERWVRVTYAPFGPLGTVANVLYEIEVEGASDSGTGTAGTDWTNIGGSIPVSPIPGYTAGPIASTAAGMVAGVITVGSALNLPLGTIVIPRAAGTGFGIAEPLFVVPQTNPLQIGFTKRAGSSVVDTTLSTGATVQTFERTGIQGQPGGPRIVNIPINANSKPWVRVVVRATPISGQVVPQWSGVWLDNVFMTSGRDSSATY